MLEKTLNEGVEGQVLQWCIYSSVRANKLSSVQVDKHKTSSNQFKSEKGGHLTYYFGRCFFICSETNSKNSLIASSGLSGM